ncbi:hypothetical protein QF021_002015 [Acidovorax delafieldii]|uniref:hypothetical protein n=1 Tax=Acidovorax delafieldii TaxID=47920 RepID=UPI00285E1298|nr:hypothetical protein [Acidovorax delafieldii]MDR6153926.1 hypothetical protein [Acidovorax delafieldii]
MTKKAQTPAVQNGNTDPNTLQLHKDPAQTDAAQIAAMALGSVAANAMTARTFAKGTFGTLDVTECVMTLKQRVDTTHDGNLKHAETTLTAQAAALDAIFNEMARRAALNMGEYLEATERYMRLALKAQGQCRATLETLAGIKNPPVIFAKQANIAHGPQQVNNDSFPSSTRIRAHARKRGTTPDELLEGPQHGSTNMDDRAATTPTRGHPAVETLEPIHWPRKPRRKSGGGA